MSDQDVLDMVCVGFGPAALAIAVALEDWLEHSAVSAEDDAQLPSRPKTLFLEKQTSFNWHAGMLLQSAKMQISFIKDLATVRDPSSRFTFLNYLKVHGRLGDFTKLNTFLPSRLEFSDYLKWAAGHFEGQVKYGHEVVRIRPVKSESKIVHFEVDARECTSGHIIHLKAKQIVIAAGGAPSIPRPFRIQHPSILHSSQYETTIDHILSDRSRDYRIAVIGSGQSAAEIFDDLATRFPNAYTTLIFRDSALRPSDDSPFVNEIFNPSATDSFYGTAMDQRLRNLKRDRSTNYSVVRLELIEKIYADLYLQDIKQPNQQLQRRRLLSSTEVVEVQTPPAQAGTVECDKVILALKNVTGDKMVDSHNLAFDAIILATGYKRNAHLDILRECQSLSAQRVQSNTSGEQAMPAGWSVRRDYSLNLRSDMIDSGVGIWLQGCNEETHGLSDSLLSVLATRSGELVQSMFGTSHDRTTGTTREQPLRAML